MSSGRTQNGNWLVTKNNIQKEVKRYKKLKNNRTWSSFEEFCDYQIDSGKYHLLKTKKTGFNRSQNQNNYICKHVKLQAIRADYVEVPNTAKTIPLHDMPKRGRPSRVSKALQIDNESKKKQRKGNKNHLNQQLQNVPENNKPFSFYFK